MKNYYCFKEMDFVLEGHFSYDLYSFIYIQFFPCVNTTEKQNCKPLEKIDYYLKNTFLSFQLQDIELTPNDYKNPFRPKAVDIYTTIGKSLFKEIHAFFQVTEVQTDMDWFGFDEIQKIKTDQYIKYDEMYTMNNIIDNNIYETGESFCDFTIKLSENMRIEKRTYTKLITILGDVGGLMEVIFTIFRIISSFSVDILYEISLVNNLFNFDLNKKVVILKDKKSEKKNSNDLNNRVDEPKIYDLTNNTKKTQNSIYNIDETVGTKSKLHNGTSSLVKDSRRKSRFKFKSNVFHFTHNINYIESTKKGIIKNNNQNNHNGVDKITSNGNIISKIRITRARIYLCFCCARKRKKIHNYLLDEGMRIISEKVDIFNIFDKMYKDEEITEKVVINKTIEMSDKCKLKLQSIFSQVYEF